MSSETSSHQPQQNTSFIYQSEESLINQYKQSNLAQESFFFTTDPITFSDIPTFLPKSVSQLYTHAIYLDNFSFYEMLTFALFQHLFRHPSQHKITLISKLKSLICSEPFFKFTSYLKALLLRALNQMIQLAKDDNYHHPLAESLMGSEKMLACCECWKEMIYNFKKEKNGDNFQPNTSVIEIFANFFSVEFQFFTKKGSEIILEVIRANNKQDIISVLPIVLIYNNSSELQEISKKQHSFSEISSIYGTWSFYILVNYPDWKISPAQEEVSLPLSKKSGLKLKIGTALILQYPQLFAINQETSRSNLNQQRQNEEIISKVRNVIVKGRMLLKQMKAFCQYQI